MKNIFLTFLGFLFGVISGTAQESISIQVGENRLIDIPYADYVIGEPHLSIHPKNDNQLLIGAMMWSTDGMNNIYCVTLTTSDGGRRWQSNKFSDKSSADPWTYINSKNEAVFTMLGKELMWTYYSRNGGLTWEDSVAHGRHHDHQTLVGTDSLVYVISAQTIRQRENLVRESVYISKSIDGGKSFDKGINLTHNNISRNTMTPVILSDGKLIISYNEYAFTTNDGKQQRLSKNHAWTISTTDTDDVFFSEPRFITDNSSGFPVLAVDQSTTYLDRLYWVSSADQGKSITIYHSTNGGESWSPETIVVRSDFQKTIPNVAINKDGIVGITWYEKHSEKFCQDFYFAASSDGGITFSKPVKVSEATSCADPEKCAGALRGGWSSGGHYTGLAAKSNGAFLAVWADARSGRYQLYISEIGVSTE